MKTLNKIRFEPSTGKGTLYIESNGFRAVHGLTLSSLPEASQQGAQVALQWLTALATANGFANVEWVFITKQNAMPSAWSEPDEEGSSYPTAYSPSFALQFFGRNADGYEGQLETNSIPGTETDAMDSLWQSLADSLNPAPIEEPEPEEE
jgi:predicted carbohydrate-binding protein with CBM5 and CBM33 domain